MGKTSAAVKNRYNNKAYDRITLVVKKGKKEQIKLYAEEHGETVNSFINKVIEEKMARDNKNGES